jgi:hypothetical protein
VARCTVNFPLLTFCPQIMYVCMCYVQCASRMKKRLFYSAAVLLDCFLRGRNSTFRYSY